MLGVIWVLAWLVVSRRIPVSFPLQLSNFCNQLGSPFIFSALQKAWSVQRDSAGSAGPVGCVCLILRHVETERFAFLSSLLWTITRQLLWAELTSFCVVNSSLAGCGGTQNPSTGRQGQENGKFEASLGYVVELCLKKKEKRKVSLSKEKTEYYFKVKMGNDHNV